MDKIGARCLLSFFMCIILQPCQSCTPFTTENLSSVDNDLFEYIREAAQAVLPVFNASTVPNLDTLIEQYNAASNSEDAHLNITQILNKYGYPTETHQVNSDGYLLDVFRIPGNGTTVLIFHGLFSSADDFVTTGTDRALAYNLADQGYDVWLGNARGNVHGRKHVTLSPKCAEFWDFSWDEIGRSDIPVTIDYILKTTGQEKLAYVGHSQGCTSYYVMASELPDYNDKVSVMVALSPAAYVKHCSSLVFDILAPIADPLYLMTQAIGLYEFLPRNPITDIFMSTACGTPSTAVLFCFNIFAITDIVEYGQLNATILPDFAGHFPGGAATKQIIHYLQLRNSGKFRKFDYGATGNLERYCSDTPPDYPLHKITSKLVIFHADNDIFGTPLDYETLIERLPNVVETYKVPYPGFTHGDYILANDLKRLINDKILEVLKKYV